MSRAASASATSVSAGISQSQSIPAWTAYAASAAAAPAVAGDARAAAIAQPATNSASASRPTSPSSAAVSRYREWASRTDSRNGRSRQPCGPEAAAALAVQRVVGERLDRHLPVRVAVALDRRQALRAGARVLAAGAALGAHHGRDGADQHDRGGNERGGAQPTDGRVAAADERARGECARRHRRDQPGERHDAGRAAGPARRAQAAGRHREDARSEAAAAHHDRRAGELCAGGCEREQQQQPLLQVPSAPREKVSSSVSASSGPGGWPPARRRAGAARRAGQRRREDQPQRGERAGAVPVGQRIGEPVAR